MPAVRPSAGLRRVSHASGAASSGSWRVQGLIVADLAAAFEQAAARLAQDDVARRRCPSRGHSAEARPMSNAPGGDACKPVGERGRFRRGLRPKAGGGGEALRRGRAGPRRGRRRAFSRRATRTATPLSVAPRPTEAAKVSQSAGRMHDAGDRPIPLDERDRHRPAGVAAHVSARAVDRVEHDEARFAEPRQVVLGLLRQPTGVGKGPRSNGSRARSTAKSADVTGEPPSL